MLPCLSFVHSVMLVADVNLKNHERVIEEASNT